MARTWVIVLVAGCYTGPTVEEQPPPPPPTRSPAFRVAGHWGYAVRTNECNAGTGTGGVDFMPRGDGTYTEAGYVVWPDGARIEWSGDMSLSRETTMANSLDDSVASRWYIDREHDQLVVRWRQSNGCSGIGIASRPGSRDPSFATLSVCARCENAPAGCVRTIEDGRSHSCPALCCR